MIDGITDRDRRDRALEQLVRRYWPAIYAYIRRTGRSVEDSADLTQGFIATIVLERDLAAKADRARGRFRSLLLRSLQNYLTDHHRQAHRHKPRAADETSERFAGLDIDAAEGREFDTPEAAFSYHWSAAMVRSVLERVRRECLVEGLDAHWVVFDARVGRPLLFGDTPTPLAELVERLDLEDRARASNMLITVKRRFARALRAEIAATLRNPDDIEDELRRLRRDLEHRP